MPYRLNGPDSAAIDKLFDAIDGGQAVLPTLPDVALKIQQMLDDMDVSINEIIAVISSDPAIVAQLIRAANSAAHADKPKVDNVRNAISRLGYRALRNQVLGITMLRLSQADHPAIKRTLNGLWEHSREVATLSYLLAKNQKHLNPDQAMLAGLVHDIGALPLCLYLDKNVARLNDMGSDVLEEIILKYRAPLGRKLLSAWRFPEEIAEVVVEHEDLQRDTGKSQADYADIVMVANLLNRVTGKSTAWEKVSALHRMHISPEICREFHERFADEIHETQDALFPQ